MAVGDIVNGIQITGASLYFQPAVGVEVCITSTGTLGNYVRLYNGTIATIMFAGDVSWGGGNCKIMINNTNYLEVMSSASNQCYTGIQLK
jgi:hypothetical protein